jgi:hypothetical protein
MKNVIFLVFIIIGIITISSTRIDSSKKKTKSYSITVLHLNAKWNHHNSLDVRLLKNCNIQCALIEDQPIEIQEKFSKIPIIALKKNGKPLILWEGNIMFEPTVTLEEIQKEIDLHK